MHGSTHDLPVAGEFETPLGTVTLREAEWGDMTVVLENFPAGTDTGPIFKGLPDDRCQCEHWGYVIKGRLRIRYVDHEETVSAGNAYYMSPGHLPFFDEDIEVVEFSPKGTYQATMEVAARNVAAMLEGDAS
ncbi:MAG TPA: hypothetical protein VHV31_10225 [Nitrolancea sp.]|nr:hypothetical protein [Nitrolancea sp.]